MKGAVGKKREKLRQQLGEHGACSDLLHLRGDTHCGVWMQAMKGAVGKKREKLRQQLGEHGACSDLLHLRLPLLLDPTVMLEGVLPEQSLVFKSAMSPLLLTFKQAGGSPTAINGRLHPPLLHPEQYGAKVCHVLQICNVSSPACPDKLICHPPFFVWYFSIRPALRPSEHSMASRWNDPFRCCFSALLHPHTVKLAAVQASQPQRQPHLGRRLWQVAAAPAATGDPWKK